MCAAGGASQARVAATEYRFAPNIGVKVRYVKEELEPQGGAPVKANHVGVSGVFYAMP